MRLLAKRFDKNGDFKGVHNFDVASRCVYFGLLISTTATAGGRSVAVPRRTCSHVAWGGVGAAGDLVHMPPW